MCGLFPKSCVCVIMIRREYLVKPEDGRLFCFVSVTHIVETYHYLALFRPFSHARHISVANMPTYLDSHSEVPPNLGYISRRLLTLWATRLSFQFTPRLFFSESSPLGLWHFFWTIPCRAGFRIRGPQTSNSHPHMASVIFLSISACKSHTQWRLSILGARCLHALASTALWNLAH